MSDDILNMNPGEIEDLRDHPDGRYEGVVVDYKVETNANGKKFVEFSFRAEGALEGQDLTGVEMNRRLYSERLYLTKDAAKYTKERLRNFGVPEGDTMGEWIESIVGAKVTFNLTTTPAKTEGGKEFRQVKSWRAAS